MASTPLSAVYLPHNDKTPYAKMKYIDEDRIVETIYINGDKSVMTSDDNGNIIKSEYFNKQGDAEIVVKNKYNSQGEIIKSSEKVLDNEQLKTISYSKQGKVESICDSGLEVNNSYNVRGNITEQKITYAKDLTSDKYTYIYDNSPTQRVLGLKRGDFKQDIEYDALGRARKINNGAISKRTSYLSNLDHATDLVSCIEYAKHNKRIGHTRYTYDMLGNIERVLDNGIESVRYHYDALSRLVREDNKQLNKTCTYSYDAGGNIVQKSIYPYTNIENIDKEAISITPYIYGLDGWSDRLLEYKGKDIKYDVIGNPTNYVGNDLTWTSGRRLTKFNEIKYTYSASGVRTSKVVNGAQTDYICVDQKLFREISDKHDIRYHYALDGIAGISIDNVEYAYIKNLQGDITKILDKLGNTVAEYVYDAWGNHEAFAIVDGERILLKDINYKAITTSATNAEQTIIDSGHIALINPIRYRGYYYDSETGLYYLQSRYYDPEVGRWINADSIEYLDPETINGLNLYAYCLNNPVLLIDSTGTSPMPNWLKWLIGGIAFVGAVVLTAVTGGALAPVFIGMGVSILAGGLIQGGINAANGGSFWQGFADGMADGALWGGVFALGGAALRTVKLFKNGVTIGENMTRVGNYAKSAGQVTYKGMPGYKAVRFFKGENVARKMSMAHNEAFIKRMMKWGVKITDIGIDVARANRSWYYFMESILVNGYNFLNIIS